VTTVASVGIRELRDHLTSILRRVRAGERVEVTHDGVPVAVISPMPNDPLDRLIAAGEASAAQAPLDLPPLQPVTSGVSASQALQEDRAE
jgi:prevent-host-death family protein